MIFANSMDVCDCSCERLDLSVASTHRPLRHEAIIAGRYVRVSTWTSFELERCFASLVSTMRTALLASLAATVCAAQLPFFERPVVQLAPESSPAHITSDEFTTLSHPDLNTNVRIKNTKGWCDPDVQSYSGYIDSRSRSLFFYFFAARHNPDKAPLTLWTNGGPGASSTMGMLMEREYSRVTERYVC